MRKVLLTAILALALAPGFSRAAFTEFYCDPSTGSNVNAGSTTGSPVLSLTGGDWVSSTGVYTKTGAVTGVSTGMFAAVMVDAGTKAALVGKVTAVDANTVTISTTVKIGSLANQTATATLKVGGAWAGPNAAEGFPLNLIDANLVSATNQFPRVNLKNNASYSVTAAVSPNQAGPVIVEGYTSTAGDGGQAILDGGNPSASFVILSLGATADDWTLRGVTVKDNGTTTGSSDGVAVNSGATGLLMERCKAQGIRGNGFMAATGSKFVECEAVNCNKANGVNTGGFGMANSVNGVMYLRSYAHGMTTANSAGFYCGVDSASYQSCISANNTGLGFFCAAGSTTMHRNCDAYNNSSDGFLFSVAGGGFHNSAYVENSNSVKNGGWGVRLANSSGDYDVVVLRNMGFGSGSQANTSGTIGTGLSGNGYYEEAGTVTYASGVTPWVDPANGDFRINLGAAKGGGRGAILGGGSTVGYPPIGAVAPFPFSGSRSREVNQ